MKRFLLLLAPLVFLPGCVPVRVAVPDPVKIDVNMKVDVTTRSEGASATATAPGTPASGPGAPGAPAATGTNAPSAAPAPGSPAASAPGVDLHKISGEIQSFKNDRLVGENNKGYLEVRQEPDGKLASGESYAAYVDRLVKEANDDRKELYQVRADKSGDPLETHELQAAQRRRDAAFVGEWIQDPQGNWSQKQQK